MIELGGQGIHLTCKCICKNRYKVAKVNCQKMPQNFIPKETREAHVAKLCASDDVSAENSMV